MTCIDCGQTMTIERVDPDGQGDDLIQYRCRLCHRIETLRLFRRGRAT
jgi:hypothetical protein